MRFLSTSRRLLWQTAHCVACRSAPSPSNGHEFEVTLSSEATAPATWECKCGQTAELIGETEEDEDNKPVKPQRTHWDMLLERRSIEELEVVLTEQLTAYREGRLRPEGSYRKG